MFDYLLFTQDKIHQRCAQLNELILSEHKPPIIKKEIASLLNSLGSRNVITSFTFKTLVFANIHYPSKLLENYLIQFPEENSCDLDLEKFLRPDAQQKKANPIQCIFKKDIKPENFKQALLEILKTQPEEILVEWSINKLKLEDYATIASLKKANLIKTGISGSSLAASLVLTIFLANLQDNIYPKIGVGMVTIILLLVFVYYARQQIFHDTFFQKITSDEKTNLKKAIEYNPSELLVLNGIHKVENNNNEFAININGKEEDTSPCTQQKLV